MKKWINPTVQITDARRLISITYDSHNMCLVVLCDDGTLWARYSEMVGDQVEWKWKLLDEFSPP